LKKELNVTTETTKFSRRSFLSRVALLTGAATVQAISIKQATAQQKVAKATMKYQDKPSGDQKCSNCVQYVPGKTPTAMGACKVVDGTISPNGWCIAWVKKA
jgi:hypothetical protein